MSSRPRVIPVLLFDGQGLVKTTRFRDPVYVGDPVNTLRIFNEKEADEIILLDTHATMQGREPDVGRLREWAGECFMPLCYGGGITAIRQAEAILRAGVEKVAVNTAFSDPALASELARAFGSQAVVAAIDAVRDRTGTWRAAVRRGRQLLPGPLADHLRRLVDAGAGEILLQCVEREGTMAGYDLDLVRSAAAAVPVPVVALGGAGSTDHLAAGLTAGASAAAAGALFTRFGRLRAVLVTYPDPGVIARLGRP